MSLALPYPVPWSAGVLIESFEAGVQAPSKARAGLLMYHPGILEVLFYFSVQCQGLLGRWLGVAPHYAAMV